MSETAEQKRQRKETETEIYMYKFAYINGCIYRKQFDVIKKESKKHHSEYRLAEGIYNAYEEDFFKSGTMGPVGYDEIERIPQYTFLLSQPSFSFISENHSFENYKTNVMKCIAKYMLSDSFRENPKYKFIEKIIDDFSKAKCKDLGEITEKFHLLNLIPKYE